MGRRIWVVLAISPWLSTAHAYGQAVVTSIEDVVEWLEPLILEETPAALNSEPRLAIDPLGGYLVTDAQASQVRVYDADGSLITYFGREGDGPGEFRNLRGVARLPSGQLSTVDFRGRLAIWTSAGLLIRDSRPAIRGVMGITPLGGSRVALVLSPVAAWTDSLDVPWVRLLDTEPLTLGAEVLSLPLTQANVSLVSSVGGDVNPTLGSRFGLTWTTFDSLWVVDLREPAHVEAIHLESNALGLNTQLVDRHDRDAFVDWMLTATFPGAVFPVPDGGWLIGLFRRRPSAGLVSGLLRVDAQGRRLWELDESPHLVASDPGRGILYFAESSGLEPNRFERARLRR